MSDYCYTLDDVREAGAVNIGLNSHIRNGDFNRLGLGVGYAMKDLTEQSSNVINCLVEDGLWYHLYAFRYDSHDNPDFPFTF